MSKDFLYEAQEVESPFELIERDMDLYGEDFWRDLDDSEFLFNYGFSKKDFQFFYSADFNLYTREKLILAKSSELPFTEQSLEKLLEDFKNETIKHLSASKVSGGNTAKKKRSAAKYDNRTSVKPSQLKAKQAQNTTPQVNKPDKKSRPLPYPAAQQSKHAPSGAERAKKEFASYKKSILRNNRSSKVKRFLNLREKALRNAIAEAGIKWGSLEWVELVKKFFPGANLTVTEPNRNDGDDQVISKQNQDQGDDSNRENGDSPQKINSGDSDNNGGQAKEEGGSGTSEDNGGGTSISVNENGGSGASNSSGGAVSESEGGASGSSGGEISDGGESSSDSSPGGGANTAPNISANSAPETTEEISDSTSGANTTANNSSPEQSGTSPEAPATSSENKPIDISKDIEGGSAAMVAGFSGTPATQMLDSFNQKANASNEALAADVAREQEAMPEIPAPTGLFPRTDDKSPEDEVKPEAPQAPDGFEAERAAQQMPPPPDITVPNFDVRQELPSPVIGDETREDADPEAMADEALAQIELDTGAIPSDIGPAPGVPLEGAANPTIAQNSQAEAQQQAAEEAAQAQTYANGDFGEQNILPDPDNSILSSEKELQMQSVSIKTEEMDVPEVPGELVAEVDKMMGTEMQPRIQQQQAEFQNQSEAKKLESEKAREDSEKEINQLQTDAISEQEAEKERAGAEIAAQKEGYQQEVTQLQQDFEADVSAKAADTNSQIAAERTRGEAEAQRHFSEAEQQAESEKTKAEAEAEKQKDEKKKEKKGLWGAIAGAVSSVVNAIKDAVNSIFEGLRSLVKGIFEAAKKLAMAAIDLATKAITGLIKAIGEVLKGLVTVLFAAFPAIQEKLLAAIDNAMNAAIERVNALADKLKSAVTAALDFLASVIDMALAFVQELYNIAFTAIGMIVRGEFAELGSYIFKSAVSLIIGTLKQFLALLGIDTETLDKIINDPIAFFKNLIESVKGGIRNFVSNIKKHLTNGLAGWLFGTLSGAGIQLPTSFSLKGVIFLVLQILNLTWGSIRGLIVKGLGPRGEALMEKAEKVVTFVVDVVTKGPMVIVERIKEFVGSLKETLIGSIIEWVRNTVIAKAIAKLITYFNPAGAIIAVIEGIYNTVMFLKERWEQIKGFCMAVMNSVKEIAWGRIDSAKGWVENSLGKAIPVTLGFLARLIGLGGISEKIKKIIKKIRKPIDKALSKVVGFVVGKVKALAGRLLGGGRNRNGNTPPPDNSEELEDNEVGKTVRYNAGGESHKIWINSQPSQPKVMTASIPMEAEERLEKWLAKISELPDDKQNQAKTLINSAKAELCITEPAAFKAKEEITEAERADSIEENREAEQADDKVESSEEKLKRIFIQLFDIFGEEPDGTILELYARHKEKVHNSALPEIKSTVDDINLKEISGSGSNDKITNWEDLKGEIKSTTPAKDIHEKPITNSTSYSGFTKNQVKKAANEVLKDQETSEINDAISKKTEHIESHQNSLAYRGLKGQILDKSREEMTDQHLISAFKGDEGEHEDYKITASDLDFTGTEDGKLVVNYRYTIEQAGQQPEERLFTVTLEPKGNMIEHTAEGFNLGIKDPGRGKTQSANSNKSRETLINAPNNPNNQLATILNSSEATNSEAKKEEINQSEHYSQQVDLQTIKFNASHLIADWFNGSGYAAALNLVLTSEHYNKVTMGGIERRIEKLLNDEQDNVSTGNGEYITFDAEVVSQWMEIADNAIAQKIKELSKEAMKAETSEQKEEVAKKVEQELTSSSNPKFCKSVEYSIFNAVLKDSSGNPIKNTGFNFFEAIGEDVHLKEILRKQNT